MARSSYRIRSIAVAIASWCLFAQVSAAQNTVHIDASAAVPAPAPLAMVLGSSRAPNGQVIGANSQYLTLDGRPWIPVMGEFHFSRYPAGEWEQEILKMKAAGVQIVAAYIIWIHHEQNEGVWDWSGQRDLRRFAELCKKHGMYLYPRIGPWAHAETRNGGLPDWVLKNGPVRQNDPVYLREVQEFYAQIAAQLKGMLWKDGGPVIGIQIENEYNKHGVGQGDEHILTLKKMAIDDGLDVPLYTVTGWDGAAIPLNAVLPVFGGYPDAPWGGTADKLPPNEVYAFRFANRSAGSMGAIGGSGQNAASTYRGTPFLTAEVGDGIEDTYFRRPVVSADDVAAIPTVMLGSGANLLGYYMFHGGRNPEGGTITLQESQRTGYPTDVPVKSYDFQAPIGEFGQERESLRKLKLVHYFLNDFGDVLAPMAPRAPAQVPSEPGDLSIPRVSARVAGDSGFVFFNNYVRGASMPDRDGFQVELKLPSGMARIPASPMRLPSGAYGIWPVNLQLPGTMLRYSTAQLFKRVATNGETYFFFSALPGVAPEFAFDPNSKATATMGGLDPRHRAGLTILPMRGETAGEIELPGNVHLIVLPETLAEQVWRVDDPSLLLASKADGFSDGKSWTLDSTANPSLDFGVFGDSEAPASDTLPIKPSAQHDLFHWYRVTVPAVSLEPQVKLVHAASARQPWQFGPALSWRPKPVPLAPENAEFNASAEWTIAVPPLPANASLADLYLNIQYQGDVARLYRGDKLIDDNFWNGLTWEIGLREIDSNWHAAADFTVNILPLPRHYPMYLEQSDKLTFVNGATASDPPIVTLVPKYRVVLHAPESR